MGLDVSDAWATPATSWNAYTYDAESTIVKETYKLHLYERNIQIGMKLFCKLIENDNTKGADDDVFVAFTHIFLF